MRSSSYGARTRYRVLGGTGIEVSTYCLGAMLFGAVGNPDRQGSVRVIHSALATKVYFPMGEGPDRIVSSRRWITLAVENSPRRLGTDWIDLYQVHRPDHRTDVEETLDVLDVLGDLGVLVTQGKIRAFGCSTFPAEDIVEAHAVAGRRGLRRFRTEQPPYSLLARGVETSVLPVAQRYGMGVPTWSPLASGFLSCRSVMGGVAGGEIAGR